MAKGSKFGALADFRKEQEGQEPAGIESLFEDLPAAPPASVASPADPVAPQPSPVSVASPAAAVIEVEPKRRGRPPGKRSDPDWKLFSHFLRRRTQRRATLLLTQMEDGRDLSDVLEELLEGWVSKNEGA